MRRNLPLLMLRVRDHIRGPFKPVFRRFGLTEQQWRIIRMLNDHREMGMGELADDCMLLRPSVVGIVSRMQELDLLRRRLDPADGRRAVISLSEKGQGLADQIIPIFNAIYNKLESTLGRQKLDQFYLILDDINVHLGADEEWERISKAESDPGAPLGEG